MTRDEFWATCDSGEFHTIYLVYDDGKKFVVSGIVKRAKIRLDMDDFCFSLVQAKCIPDPARRNYFIISYMNVTDIV